MVVGVVIVELLIGPAWMPATTADSPALPAPVDIPVCSNMPAIDGNLGDTAWEAAALIANFVIIDGEGRFVPTTNVTARLTRDTEWLYVGFDVKHPLPANIVQKVTRRDERVQAENCVKVALDPGTEGKQWYLFRLSAHNVRADQRNTSTRDDLNWNIPWRSATRITETGWQAEIALPLALLMKGENPRKAKINLLAHTFTPVFDACAVQIDEKRMVAGLALTPPAWWTPQRFVPITGLAGVTFTTPFLPMLEKVAVSPYALAEGHYAYGVTGSVRNFGDRGGRVVIRVQDESDADASEAVVSNDVATPVELKGDGTAPLTMAVPVRSLVRRKVRVDMVAESGEALERVQVDTSALDVFSAFLDRNYYTTEKEAGVVCRIGLPEVALKGTRLVARMEPGEILGKTRNVRPVTEWKFPLKKVKEGAHAVRIEFRNTDDELIADQTATLIKRAPKPGREWKIDRGNRVVLNNGEPFFPFGPVMGGVRPDDEEAFQTIAEAGFNTFFKWTGILKPEEAPAYQRLAEKHGLYVVEQYEGYAVNPWKDDKTILRKYLSDDDPADRAAMNYDWNLTGLKVGMVQNPALARLKPWQRTEIFDTFYNANVKRMMQAVELTRDSPNLAAYNSFDEPLYKSFFDNPRFLDDIYRRSLATDGYHPTMLLYSSWIPDGDEYVTPCDILCTDPYWIPTAPEAKDPTCLYGSINYVSRVVYLNDQRAQKYRQAVWIMPVGWIYSGILAAGKRGLTLEEQQCQSFLAIIHGARGLFWFAWPMPTTGWENLKQVAAMIKVIGPMAVQPQVGQDIHYWSLLPDGTRKPMTFAPKSLQTKDSYDNYPDIQARLFRDPKGGLVLLAANSRHYPVQVEFRVSGLKANARRMFADVELQTRDGVFEEQLEQLGVRAYRLGELSEPVEVDIAARRPVELPPLNLAYENKVRPGRKNVLPNPSFEEETIKGAPDYYFGFGKEGIVLEHDQSLARFGAKCVRVTIFEKLLNGNQNGFTFNCAPQHDAETTYAWSLWLRAEPGIGTTAEVGLRAPFADGSMWKNIMIDKEWKRYSFPVIIKPHIKTYGNFAVYPRGPQATQHTKGNTIWVDGLQLEKGTETTPFEE